jgi:hypothetical protein
MSRVWIGCYYVKRIGILRIGRTGIALNHCQSYRFPFDVCHSTFCLRQLLSARVRVQTNGYHDARGNPAALEILHKFSKILSFEEGCAWGAKF